MKREPSDLPVNLEKIALPSRKSRKSEWIEELKERAAYRRIRHLLRVLLDPNVLSDRRGKGLSGAALRFFNFLPRDECKKRAGLQSWTVTRERADVTKDSDRLCRRESHEVGQDGPPSGVLKGSNLKEEHRHERKSEARTKKLMNLLGDDVDSRGGSTMTGGGGTTTGRDNTGPREGLERSNLVYRGKRKSFSGLGSRPEKASGESSEGVTSSRLWCAF